jgi:hypothetical protein
MTQLIDKVYNFIGFIIEHIQPILHLSLFGVVNLPSLDIWFRFVLISFFARDTHVAPFELQSSFNEPYMDIK